MTSYNDIPYHTAPHHRSHPLHLATVATLCGLPVRNPHRARILELGCGNGGNLIPIAATLPGAECVGVDGASEATKKGSYLIEALGLQNVRLLNKNFVDADLVSGEFDYIIVHGVISWISTEMVSRVFDVIADHLALHGVAYLTYNTYPGWSIRRTYREAALLLNGQEVDPSRRVVRTKQLLGQLARAIRSEDGYDTTFLRQELQKLANLPEWFLCHDLLEEQNNPFYFYQFMAHVRSHELQFLAEADLSKAAPMEFDRETVQFMNTLNTLDGDTQDRIVLEQVMDFFRMRMFRGSIVCRAEHPIQQHFQPAVLYRSFLSSPIAAEASLGELLAEGTVRFSHPNGSAVSVSDLPAKAAMHLLSVRWPSWVTFEDLAKGITEYPYNLSVPDAGLLIPHLYRCMLANVIELSFYEPPLISKKAPEHPFGFGPARIHAISETEVPTLRHDTVSIPPLARQLLPLLDGSRDIKELSGKLGQPIATVKGILAMLGKKALLMG